MVLRRGVRGWIVAEEQVSLAYDGAAVDEHRMNVRDLAPALLATADLFRESQRLLYPDEPALNVSIQAERPGSVLLELVVEVAGLIGAVQQSIAAGASMAMQLRALIDSVLQAIQLIRELAGSNSVEVRDNGDGTTTLVIDEVKQLNVTNNVYVLSQEPTVRRSARDAMAPLRGAGYEWVSLRHDDVAVQVTREEYVDAFDRPELEAGDVEVTTSTGVQLVTVESVAFDDRQWRLSDGDRTFSASMSDAAFMERVRSRDEVFAAGDVLRVRLHVQQSLDPDGTLHTSRHVEQVLAHIPAGRNDPLPGLDA